MSNWVGYSAPLVVTLFLTPVIFHCLKAERYGVMTLMFSVGSYLGLVDMGIGMSIGRYVNLYMARKEPEKVNYVINSAIPFFVLAGAVLVGLTLILAGHLGQIFPKISVDELWEAKLLLVLVAVQVILDFLVNTLVAIPTAHERFDVCNGIGLSTLLVRAGLTYFLLKAGGGLVALGLINVGTTLLTLVCFAVAAKRIDPSIRFSPRWFRWEQFRELISFAGGAMFNIVAQKVIYCTDLLIIMWFLGSSEIAFYSFGLSFVIYGRGFLREIVRTFYPVMAKHGDGEDLETIRRITLRTSRIVMLFTIPLMAGFITLGHDFIMLWLTDPRCVSSAQVLLILALGQTVSMSCESWRSMLVSLGHIWHVGLYGVAEAVSNIALSLLFVIFLGWGINGVAWGTTIPAVLLPGIAIPLLGARMIGLPKRELLRASWSWLLAMAACCLVGFAVARVPLPATWAGPWAVLVAKIVLAGGAMWLSCWYIVTVAQDRHTILSVFRTAVQRGWATVTTSAPRAAGAALENPITRTQDDFK